MRVRTPTILLILGVVKCDELSSWVCKGVCPDGSPPQLPDQVIDGDLTCGIFDKMLGADFVSDEGSEYCKMMTGSDSRRSKSKAYSQGLAYYCACPNVPKPPTFCNLCESGQDLPIPHRKVVNGASCIEVQNETSFNIAVDFALEEEEESRYNCLDLQATVGIGCGCVNPEALAKSEACHICGSKSPLPEPMRIIDKYGSSCLEREIHANTQWTNCTQEQEKYSDFCCKPSVVVEDLPTILTTPLESINNDKPHYRPPLATILAMLFLAVIVFFTVRKQQQVRTQQPQLVHQESLIGYSDDSSATTSEEELSDHHHDLT